MKIHKLILAFLITSICFINSLKSQTYSDGVGIRIGIANGVDVSLDYKHFFSEKIAGEAFINFNTGFTIFGALLESHQYLQDVSSGLTFYYGGGLGLATGSGFSRLVLIGIAGLDFKFEALPIDIAFDWTPNLLLGEGGRFSADSISLIGRYTF
ncbi:MAG: hypothetical protein AAGK97_14380, partial [Bacteroidota bacterium]